MPLSHHICIASWSCRRNTAKKYHLISIFLFTLHPLWGGDTSLNLFCPPKRLCSSLSFLLPIHQIPGIMEDPKCNLDPKTNKIYVVAALHASQPDSIITNFQSCLMITLHLMRGGSNKRSKLTRADHTARQNKLTTKPTAWTMTGHHSATCLHASSSSTSPQWVSLKFPLS